MKTFVFTLAVAGSLWSTCNAQDVSLPKSGDRTVAGQYGVGAAVVTVVTNPSSPLTGVVSVASPAANGKFTCPNGPLGSVADTCTGTLTASGATIAVTIKTDSSGITSIGVTSATNGATTTLVDPSKPVSKLLPVGASAAGNKAMTRDPISTATGGLDAGPFFDFKLGGPLPLTLRRFYSSGLGASFGQNPAGYNWTTNFDSYVGISGNFAVVALEGGGTVSFQLNGGTYKPIYAARRAYQLVRVAAGFRFMNPDNNLIYNFDSNGFLSKIDDRNGNALTVTRSIQGVTQVSDGLGRTLTFSYANTAQPSLARVQDQTGRSVTFAHDANYNLTSITDANGNTTSYSYSGGLLTKTVRPRGNAPYAQTFDPATGAAISQVDSQGNTTKLTYVAGNQPGITVVKDPLGRPTTYNYSDPTLTNLTSVVDAAGNTSASTYDSANRPITFTDRLGNKSSTTYDQASGYPASVTDAQGNTTTWTYQSQVQGDFTFYNLAKIGYADGTAKTFTYDAAGNALVVTDRAGKKTTNTYNSRGQVLTETNPAGGVTTSTYNADGTLASVKMPSGDVTTYSYDTLMRLAKIQNADSTSKSFTRDALDQILTITNERGKTAKLAYDPNNNLQSTTDALNKSAGATYDTDDLLSSNTDRLGNSTQIAYDPLGSPIGITNEAGEQTTFGYDNLERLQTISDPDGKIMNLAYDAEGRLASVIDARGNQTKYQVDKNGNRTQIFSPLGATTAFTYDSVNRVTGVTDALGRQTNTTYEGRGLVSGITAPGGVSASFAWGDLPLLSGVTDPNGNVWPITRDAQGRVTATTDPLGHANKFTYDARNRVVSFTSPVDSAQLTYDAAGNLTQAQFSDNVTLSYSYDDNNRLLSGTGVSLSYDANGRITGSNGLGITRDAAGPIASITYAAGKTVTYTYDTRGLLSRITDWANGGMNFTFDDAHRLISQRGSNGIITGYNYDKDSRLVGISYTGALLSVGSIGLTRDVLGRVTTASHDRLQEAIPAPASSTRSYDAANQIAGATYDGRGRLTNDNAGATYHWTASSRLQSYARPDGAASAAYDALGQRISRTINGTTQNYVINYATDLPSVTTIQSGKTDVRYFVYTPEGLLLYSIEAATGAHHYYSFDETGSTTFLTDNFGQVSDAYGISAYGDIVTGAPYNTSDNPFTWQGRFGVMQEAGTKLYYMRYRYYDAVGARFLSRDPLLSMAPAEVNPYQYAAGNPLANSDPRGLKTGAWPEQSLTFFSPLKAVGLGIPAPLSPGSTGSAVPSIELIPLGIDVSPLALSTIPTGPIVN